MELPNYKYIFQLKSSSFLFRFKNFYVAVFILTFIFSACERVIDVDLNVAAPQIVIEGNLSYNNSILEVKVSKTESYFNKAPAVKVEDAIVELTAPDGTKTEVKHVKDGIYKTEKRRFKSEGEYALSVESDGEKYTAISRLHKVVDIDSLSYEYQRDMHFFNEGYRVSLYIADPPDENNFYRVKIYKNEKLYNKSGDIMLFDDVGLNGRGIRINLRSRVFDSGDTVKVELYTIDKSAWLYFSTLKETAGFNAASPAPSNPVSNFNNGALGYFSAWSVSRKEIIIRE